MIYIDLSPIYIPSHQVALPFHCRVAIAGAQHQAVALLRPRAVLEDHRLGGDVVDAWCRSAAV